MKGPFSLLDHPPCHDVGERGPERHLLSPFEPSSGEYDVGLRVSSRWDLTQNTLGGTAISYTYISQAVGTVHAGAVECGACSSASADGSLISICSARYAFHRFWSILLCSKSLVMAIDG